MRPNVSVQRHKLSERGNDLYETPACAVDALLKVETLPSGAVWEPACGPGSIARTLRAKGHQVWATDLVDYQSPDQDEARQNFLMSDGYAPFYIGSIVTNPPFKLAEQFARRAIILCPRVYFLLRLAFMESERRTTILEKCGLARVHVFSRRLPMMHRQNWDGPKASSGMAFAWFVWERGHQGPTEIHRLSWDKP